VRLLLIINAAVRFGMKLDFPADICLNYLVTKTLTRSVWPGFGYKIASND
jgi:hypothetical protein